MPLSAIDFTQSDYSFAERLLHHLALGLPWVTKASFDFDDLVFGTGQRSESDRHIFISGLARSGTTILMRAFYQTGQFRSLTYRDMPFVLMPRTWHKLTRLLHTRGVPKERAHGDGISVEFDSPEAFEEVFWRTFAGQKYILNDHLSPHTADQELIKMFRSYVRRVLASATYIDQKRYLSKNNNNVLRLVSIRDAFPRSHIIIPFRDPFQQSASLLEQHMKFTHRHSHDKFSYHFMQWLGHHEFGLTHKPFRFSNTFDSLSLNRDLEDVNYWLSLWNNTYQYLLDSSPTSSIFVCFEDLCNSSNKTLENLLNSTGVRNSNHKLEPSFRLPPFRAENHIDEELKSQAEAIYTKLRYRVTL
jgi:hypothetical protein